MEPRLLLYTNYKIVASPVTCGSKVLLVQKHFVLVLD